MNTIPDYVHRWASECPEKPAIISRDVVISYRELYDRMKNSPSKYPLKGNFLDTKPSSFMGE